MKIMKVVFICLTLMLMGMLISYADLKSTSEYNKLIETFNNTDAKFKFYNIKANATIDYKIEKNEMKDICIEIISNLGLEESDTNWDESENDKEIQIYTQTKTDEKVVSIIFIKKNDEESYIMVDILQNKVYKNIVDIYTVLENTLEKYSSDLDVNTCISGEYEKKLQKGKYNDILNEILYNMKAKEIDRIQDENFISMTAYTKEIKGNYLEYLGEKINLNIGIRYSEDEEKTMIYIATPIIKLDY